MVKALRKRSPVVLWPSARIRSELGGQMERHGSGKRDLQRILFVISSIPRGKVITYGKAAEGAGVPRGARLTVWALRSSDGVPWHRVVAAQGRIALRGAEGQEQRLRLELEGVTFRRGRVRMDRHEWHPRGRTLRSPGAGVRAGSPGPGRQR